MFFRTPWTPAFCRPFMETRAAFVARPGCGAASPATAESRLRIAEMRSEKLLGRAHERGSQAAGTNGELVQKLRELLEMTEAGDWPQPSIVTPPYRSVSAMA